MKYNIILIINTEFEQNKSDFDSIAVPTCIKLGYLPFFTLYVHNKLGSIMNKTDAKQTLIDI